VQTWRLGDGPHWVFLGGEVVVDFAGRLKSELGPGRTWVVGYCNDVMAYIASRRVLAEGGYEGAGAMVYYGLPAPWAPSSEDAIVAAVRGQVEATGGPPATAARSIAPRPYPDHADLTTVRDAAGPRPIDTAADFAPELPGENVTLMVQEPPTATLLQLLLCVNWPASAPLKETPLIVSPALPVLLTVTACAALEVPTVCAANDSVVVPSEIFGANTIATGQAEAVTLDGAVVVALVGPITISALSCAP